MLNKRTYRDGKPVELQDRVRIGLDMSAEERRIIKFIGQGNMSEGIRIAVNFYLVKNNIKLKDL
jgi:hypothetical protein